MLSLQTVTLIAVDCLDAERARASIDRCTALCNYGAVKLLTSKETSSPHKVKIDPINSLYEYSEFILKHVWEHCPTAHMQIIQYDGWILNPKSWEDDWLRYDYIGALFRGEGNVTNDSVGNGGFSLRTKRLMQYVSENLGPFNSDVGWRFYFNEDGVICKGMKSALNQAGFNIAPPDRAARYAFEGNPAYFFKIPFGFHGFHALKTLEEA